MGSAAGHDVPQRGPVIQGRRGRSEPHGCLHAGVAVPGIHRRLRTPGMSMIHLSTLPGLYTQLPGVTEVSLTSTHWSCFVSKECRFC